MIKKNKKFNQGFTLVETLVAISIFSISIVAVMSTLGSSVSNVNYAKQKVIAEYLAQEGIEYMRNMRDNYTLYQEHGGDWTTFVSRMSQCVGNDCGFDQSITNTSVNSTFTCIIDPNKCKLYVNNGNYNDSMSARVGVDSGFTRSFRAINITDINGVVNEIKIISSVSWNSGARTNKVSFSENLFNWIER